MAVKQSASLTGVPDRDVRLSKPVVMQTLEDVASDQALCYEVLTGQKVPESSAIVATPHVHDGTDGQIIPIPLAYGISNVRLNGMSASGTPGYGKVVYTPFRCPPGVTKAVWIGLTHSLATADSLKVHLENSTLVQVEMARVPGIGNDGIPVQGQFAMLTEVTTAPGEVNVLSVEALDDYAVPPGRDLLSWVLYPLQAEGSRGSPPWLPPRVSTTRVKVPGLTQHLGAHAFTSMDAGFFTDKRSIHSWMLQGMTLNDALLYELATGRPAGDNGTGHTNDRRYEGHTHGGESDLDNTGALIEQPIGAWSYGVARASSGSSGHMNHDAVDSTYFNQWVGRIHAPTIVAGGTGDNTVAKHLHRLPALDEQYARDTVGGATTKLSAAVLCRVDTAKITQVDIKLRLTAVGGGSPGTQVTQSKTSNGLGMLTFNDLDASADPGSTGILQELEVVMAQDAAQYPGCCIYGRVSVGGDLMPLITSPWPPQPLDRAHTQTDADLVMEHARVSGGNAATLYGYLTGVEEVGDNTPNPAPPAPGHGLRCHDHSGGDFGRPLFRPIWAHSGGEGQAYAGGNLSVQANAWVFFEGGLIDGALEVTDGLNFSPFGVQVPGCDPEIGAYAHLGVQGKAYWGSSNTLVTGDVVTFNLYNFATGHKVSWQLDETLSSSSEDFASDNTNDPSELLETVPGELNLVRAYFEVNCAGSGSSRAVEVELSELELGVYET